MVMYKVVEEGQEVIKLLLEGGADIMGKNKNGCTALHWLSVENE